MSGDKISRKDFLKKVSFAGISGLGISAFLAACSGGGKNQGGNNQRAGSVDTSASAMNQKQKTGTGEYATSEGACTDLSGVSKRDINTRKTLQYVDKSPNKNQRCDNCTFYLANKYGSQCGGCQLFKGPISPGGHCTSWTPKA